MRSGSLDRRIRLETRNTTADSFGEPIDTPAILATVAAQVLPLKASEVFADQQFSAGKALKFIIRHRTDVNETVRIIYEGDAFDIQSVSEIGRREGLEIIAAALVPTV